MSKIAIRMHFLPPDVASTTGLSHGSRSRTGKYITPKKYCYVIMCKINAPSAGEKAAISHSSVVIRERLVRSAIGGRNCNGCDIASKWKIQWNRPAHYFPIATRNAFKTDRKSFYATGRRIDSYSHWARSESCVFSHEPAIRKNIVPAQECKFLEHSCGIHCGILSLTDEGRMAETF